MNSGTKFIVLSNSCQSVVRSFAKWLGRVIEEVSVGTLSTSTNSASNLVQLGKAEVFGSINNQSICVWNVDSSFDDRGGDQNIKLLFPEVNNYLLQSSLRHLPVCHSYASLRNQLCKIICSFFDGCDSVVNKEDLSFSDQLSSNRSRNLLLAVAADEGENWMPILWRSCKR